MSSTRHADPGSELPQERFASSAEFERGLNGAMVARRCSVLDDPKDKRLVWHLQYLSHQPGGLNAIVSALLEQCSERIGTAAMRSNGKRAGQKSPPTKFARYENSCRVTWRRGFRCEAKR